MVQGETPLVEEPRGDAVSSFNKQLAPTAPELNKKQEEMSAYLPPPLSETPAIGCSWRQVIGPGRTLLGKLLWPESSEGFNPYNQHWIFLRPQTTAAAPKPGTDLQKSLARCGHGGCTAAQKV